ncbi:MAG TPA: aldehyde dehydrogenase family protein [Planctomycetota bacterium]|nr:aldehyde dehydrogenase family protein [Planctomycetota bacterium]
MQNLDPDLRALQEVRDFVERAKRAHEIVHSWSQAQIDKLCAAMAEAGEAAAHDLARVAVEETGIGRVHYKVLKNLLGSRGIWNSMKSERSVGVISRDERTGIVEVATPVGVIAGIIPTTNPTSTALGKALIAVKGRNAIVISPHPRSKRCIGETVEVLRRAIERAGGPPDLVLSLSNPTIESTSALMKHKHVALILSTGGSGLVTAAYSSGKPAYGVGPGNVPCYIDRTADVPGAARAIVTSQSFDNGTLCCSEQGLVIDKPIEKALIGELKKRGAHVCSEEEVARLAKLCNVGGHMNADVVGLDPWRIAELAGFNVPRETSVLLAYQGGVGPKWPLSIEILAPLLSVHVVEGWKAGCEISMQMLHYGGLGHTCAVHARDEAVLEAWFLEKPASRIIVNGPSSMGAVGYSTWLMPSMSLGCGPQAGNITSDNITYKHLLNIKRAAFPRKDWLEIEARDHAWAAKFTRETAPRGSGLPGDPALAIAAPLASTSAFSAPAASNWQGNAVRDVPVSPSAGKGFVPKSFVNPTVNLTPPARVEAKVQAAPKAPMGSGAGFGAGSAMGSAQNSSASSVATLAPPPPAPAAMTPRPPAASSGANVGSRLSTAEIQNIMAHAGAGCPLGPCKGCEHHDVATGACLA